MSEDPESRNITPPPSLVSDNYSAIVEDEEEGLEAVEEQALEIEYTNIFINHVNSYHGKFLVTEIQNLSKKPVKPPPAEEEEVDEEDAEEDNGPLYFRIHGTWKTYEEEDVQVWNSKDIVNVSPESYEQILNCEYIIYDINSSDTTQVTEAYATLKEIEAVCDKIDGQNEEGRVTHFILISTIMTWGETKTDIDRDTFLTESDYRKRRPHVCYMQHMNLEKEVINAQKRHPNCLRTLVICPGVTYGGKEDVLHYIFKMAFYNKEDIEIFKPGNNAIPMIYVKDLMRMIASVLRKFPDPKIRYLLALQKEIVDVATFARLIGTTIGTASTRVKVCTKNEMFMIDAKIMTQRVFNHCSLNLALSTKYFEDFQYEISGEDFHLSAPKICAEFYEARGLAPIKIMIHGPPFSGKSTLAKALSKYYNLPIIQRKELFETSINRLKHKIYKAELYLKHFENSVDVTPAVPYEFIEDISNNIADWKSKIESILSNKNRKENFQVVKMCLLDRLNSSLCAKNQGYILEGFDITREQAQQIFFSKENDDGDNAEEEEDDETEKPVGELNEAIRPHFVIMLNANDHLLYERGRATMDQSEFVTEEEDVFDQFDEINFDDEPKPFIPATQKKTAVRLSTILENTTDEENEDYLIHTPAERDDMDCDKFDIRDVIGLRILEYRANDYEDLSLLNFFLDLDIIPAEINLTPTTTPEEIFNKVKILIGSPRKYPLTSRELKELDEVEMMALKKLESEQRKLHMANLEREQAEHEFRMREYAEALLKAKQEELQLIEERSLPLRHYLMQTIIPRLTKGLLEVAKVRPADPIDYLADYLFRHNSGAEEISETLSFLSNGNEEDIVSKDSTLKFDM